MTTVPLSLQKLIPGQMRFMADRGFKVTMISTDFEQKRELKEEERADFIPIDMTRSITPWADLKALWKLIKLFRKLHPTIVHTHTPKAGLLGMLAAWAADVPLRLHTVAGLPLLETKGWKRTLLVLVEKLTYACSTQVYPNSHRLYELLLERGFCRKEKLKVIGNGSSNGIDIHYYQQNPLVAAEAAEIRNRLHIRARDFVFLFVGRLVRDKGLVELVNAFTALAARYPEIKLVLVGPFEQELDPLPSDTLQTIREHAAIHHLDYQEDTRPYFAMANVLVLPSYREGFPNVLMQAGCLDLPCIATDINGCNEIIVEKQNGLLVSKKDSTRLVEAMELLLRNDSLYRRLKANARRMIVERYEQQQFWALVLKEYDLLLRNVVY